MKSLSGHDIVSIINAKVIGMPSNRSIKHLLIDSRKLFSPDGTLFFAIKTPSNDGHHYIEELYSKGVRSFVVQAIPDPISFPAATFFVVSDVIHSLQSIASYHRNHFSIPVIAITGSNGKTIVKEWLYHLLHPFFQIVRSPRSFNSQLGVPLSIWQMQEVHQLAIFEAGISKPQEMEALAKMIQPTIGIFTNIGEAHAEGFFSSSEKLSEKMKLFTSVDLLIYCKDHTQIDQYASNQFANGKGKKVISWGRTAAADIEVTTIVSEAHQTFIEATYNKITYSFLIPFVDKIAIENALHCFAACIVLGKASEVIPRMKELPSLAMRLEVKEGQHQSIVINDSYNADITGVLSAIEFLSEQKEGYAKTAILSDVSGLSDNAEAAYIQLANFLFSKKITTLYGVGSEFQKYIHHFHTLGSNISVFATTEELMKHLHPSFFKEQVVLVKGARPFHFEQISQLLETKIHKTRLEVNLSSVVHNLKQFRSKLQPSTKIMAMVKAFSYGAGSFEIANLLQFNHVDYISVAYVDEGVELRKAGIRLPIMVMNVEGDGFSSLVEYDLEPEVYSLELAKKLHTYLEKEGIQFFPIHLKIDTGMHRLGLDSEQIASFLHQFSQSRFIIQSVFTHLVASEDAAEDDFTNQQLDIFDAICFELKKVFSTPFLRHACNTAAILRHPRASYEMVRLGIGLYGVQTTKQEFSLTEAVELKTTIAQIRRVKKGESVGYGRGTILKKDSIIATIRIGYADGFPRTLGNGKGEVMIRGNKYPTIGNICMDMTMIDLGDENTFQVDDEVLLFGKAHSIKNLALKARTIPYEIMTGISQRVPRVYLSE
jgi:alanine racemase